MTFEKQLVVFGLFLITCAVVVMLAAQGGVL
jgi:hypothetical protein